MLYKILATVMLVGVLITPVSSGAQPEAGTIVWGKVSLEPIEKIKKWQPFADYLAANLGEFDIRIGQIKVAPDMATMGDWLASGEVDLFSDSFYPATIVSELSGAVTIALSEKDEPDKHAVFFTRTDSGLTSLTDLAGQMITFEEPYSNSGFMLPMAYLLKAGMKPVEKANSNSTVAPNEIGYVFCGDDEFVLQWVARGKVTAGVADNETFQEFSEATPGMLAILAETESVIRGQIMLARPHMDLALQEAIRTVLLEMENTREGRVLLEEFGIQRFTILSEGRETDLARAQGMYDRLKRR